MPAPYMRHVAQSQARLQTFNSTGKPRLWSWPLSQPQGSADTGSLSSRPTAWAQCCNTPAHRSVWTLGSVEEYSMSFSERPVTSFRDSLESTDTNDVYMLSARSSLRNYWLFLDVSHRRHMAARVVDIGLANSRCTAVARSRTAALSAPTFTSRSRGTLAGTHLTAADPSLLRTRGLHTLQRAKRRHLTPKKASRRPTSAYCLVQVTYTFRNSQAPVISCMHIGSLLGTLAAAYRPALQIPLAASLPIWQTAVPQTRMRI
ncbi:hypothetical protein C7974DRAFT_380252 [Boeremia exigua]|uniref:uncharacterized protein n=1 Tax=Boeremia exigua TaxID=749465 RepID=UPI001E8D7872|nr:uncharacterized protein C7974DRAFT_380252 [Boeremia exigua]KAH6613830.1 hypothetical protein C7974DRAFT_380252 [Boeremia exigua]